MAQRLGQRLVGGELVALAHHGDGEQPGHVGVELVLLRQLQSARGSDPARAHRGPTKASDIEKGRQID